MFDGIGNCVKTRWNKKQKTLKIDNTGHISLISDAFRSNQCGLSLSCALEVSACLLLMKLVLVRPPCSPSLQRTRGVSERIKWHFKEPEKHLNEIHQLLSSCLSKHEAPKPSSRKILGSKKVETHQKRQNIRQTRKTKPSPEDLR